MGYAKYLGHNLKNHRAYGPEKRKAEVDAVYEADIVVEADHQWSWKIKGF